MRYYCGRKESAKKECGKLSIHGGKLSLGPAISRNCVHLAKNAIATIPTCWIKVYAIYVKNDEIEIPSSF